MFEDDEVIFMDEVLEPNVVHIKVSPSSSFFLKVGFHIEVSSNHPKGVSMLLFEICNIVKKLRFL